MLHPPYVPINILATVAVPQSPFQHAHGVPYTKVCGRAHGYQYYATPTFHDYHYASQTTLNSAYVSGLSVTYGSPRNHIWTFAAGYSKDKGYTCCNCPCAPYPGPAAPPFIVDKYFCESGKLEYFNFNGT